MLVNETLCMCASEEHKSKTYHSLVLQGNLWTAVRWIMEQETKGVLQPAELFTKTGDRVMEVLHTKHRDACHPTAASMDL